MEREYGIGRVPADVDQSSEALAEVEAAEIMARQQAQQAPRAARPVRRCSYRGCTNPGTMSASLGPACPDHYDALSD